MSMVLITKPDVDGVLAASILLAAVGAEWSEDPVQFANYQDLESKLRVVLASTNVDELYLVDLGVEQISRTTFDGSIFKTRLHLVDHLLCQFKQTRFNSVAGPGS